MRLWLFSHYVTRLAIMPHAPRPSHICLMAQPVSPRWHTRPCVLPRWRHLILCHFLYMFSSAPHISLEFFSRLQGVQFVFDCCMGLRPYDGEGCILADDMGLGHIYTHFPHLSHAILPIYQPRFSFFRLQAKLSNRSPSSGLSCARFKSRFFRMPQLILARLLVWQGPGAKRPLRRFFRLRLLFNQLSRLRCLEYLSF